MNYARHFDIDMHNVLIYTSPWLYDLVMHQGQGIVNNVNTKFFTSIAQIRKLIANCVFLQ